MALKFDDFCVRISSFFSKANLFIKREKDGMGKKLMYTQTSLKWFSFVPHLPQGSEQRYFKQQKPLSRPQHHEISLHSILDEMPFSAQDCVLNHTKEKGERGWLEQWDHPSGCNLSSCQGAAVLVLEEAPAIQSAGLFFALDTSGSTP